jgi:hypothetical protein
MCRSCLVSHQRNVTAESHLACDRVQSSVFISLHHGNVAVFAVGIINRKQRKAEERDYQNMRLVSCQYWGKLSVTCRTFLEFLSVPTRALTSAS